MRRREFAGIAAIAAAWPMVAGAQKPVTVIGLLTLSSREAPSGPIEAIHLALEESGYQIGQNVRIEYRYANHQPERLSELAAELVGIPVALIITTGGPRVAIVAKGATATIPIVFAPVSNPVENGLVDSLNKPGGNATGVAALTIELDPKRLELLNEISPSDRPLGVLLNPTRPDAREQKDGLDAAARSVKRELVVAGASTVDEINRAFPLLAQRSIAGLLVAADPLFSSQEKRIVDLANRYRWPAVYQWREFVDAGGIASYGPSRYDSYRQVGLYAVRILRGERPANLPVQQPTKFELVINLKTAKALGLTVPQALLARADEVIE